MSEKRSADARSYDYLAYVRVLNLRQLHLDEVVSVLRIEALSIWDTLPHEYKNMIDSRFHPGAEEGP